MDSPQQLELHVSIQKGLTVPPLEKCITCCSPSRYHCPFCVPEMFKPSKYFLLSVHLKRHFKSAVYAGDYTIHKCGLGCRSQHHYHCLFCPATLIRRVNFRNHLISCSKPKQRTTLTFIQGGLTEGQVAHLPISERTKIPSFAMESNDDYKGMSFILDSDDQNSRGASSSRSVTSPDSEYEAAGLNSSKWDQCVQTDFDKPQDCDEFYFMTLVKIFKKLSPEKQANVRMKIERLLFEAEFE